VPETMSKSRSLVVASVAVIALSGVVVTTWFVMQLGEDSHGMAALPVESRAAAASATTEVARPNVEHGRTAVEHASSELEQRSEARSVLAVRVVRPGGSGPVVGAELTALEMPSRHGAEPHRTYGTTDQAGSARLVVAHGERIVLEAVDPASSVGIEQFLAPLVQGELREVELVLAVPPVAAPKESTTFHGIAVDASGRAIAGAQVFVGAHESLQWIDATPPPSKRPAAETDAGGRFVVAAQMGDSMAVRVQAPGFWHAIAAFEPGHATHAAAREVVLLAPASLVAHVGPLSPEELLDARVVCTSPAPSLTRDGEGGSFSMVLSLETMRWEARPDAQGRARFERLPPGQALTLAVRGLPSTRTLTHLEFRLEPSEVREVHLERGSGARIVGSVHDRSGAPLPGVELALLPGEVERFVFLEFQSDANLRSVETDSGGGFLFEDVPDGPWTLGPRDGGALVLEPLTFAVAGRRQNRELALVGVLGLHIAGLVQTLTGEPASNVEVVARAKTAWAGDTAETDSTGRFRIGPLPPGEYLLCASISNSNASLGPENALRVQAGAQDVLLWLPEVGELRVRLVNAGTGVPIEGVLLVSPISEGGLLIGGSIHSVEASGELTVEDLSHGHYDLVAWSENGLMATTARVSVPTAGAPVRSPPIPAASSACSVCPRTTSSTPRARTR
jgi:hypothetical protein